MKTIEEDITEFRDFLKNSINDSDKELLADYKNLGYDELLSKHDYLDTWDISANISMTMERIYVIRVLTNILELRDVEKKF